ATFHQRQDDALESDGKSGSRHVLTEDLADQLVVAAPAGDRGRELGRAHLEDRTRVVRHAPDQRRIEGQSPASVRLTAQGPENHGEGVDTLLAIAASGLPQSLQTLLGRDRRLLISEEALQPGDGGWRVTGSRELSGDPRPLDLVQLVEGDEDAVVATR